MHIQCCCVLHSRKENQFLKLGHGSPCHPGYWLWSPEKFSELDELDNVFCLGYCKMIPCAMLVLPAQVSAGNCMWSQGLPALHSSMLGFYDFAAGIMSYFLLNQPSLFPKCCTENQVSDNRISTKKGLQWQLSCKANHLFLPSSPFYEVPFLLWVLSLLFPAVSSAHRGNRQLSCVRTRQALHFKLHPKLAAAWKEALPSPVFQIIVLKCWETGRGNALFESRLHCWVEKRMSFQNGSQCSMLTCFNYPGVKNKSLGFVGNVSRTADVNKQRGSSESPDGLREAFPTASQIDSHPLQIQNSAPGLQLCFLVQRSLSSCDKACF